MGGEERRKLIHEGLVNFQLDVFIPFALGPSPGKTPRNARNSAASPVSAFGVFCRRFASRCHLKTALCGRFPVFCRFFHSKLQAVRGFLILHAFSQMPPLHKLTSFQVNIPSTMRKSPHTVIKLDKLSPLLAGLPKKTSRFTARVPPGLICPVC